MVLAYPGKSDPSTVLRHSPEKIESLWRHPLAQGNRLYYGDNLDVLAELTRDNSISGQVQLVYIDPPFATEGIFLSRNQEHAYSDILSGAEYIENIRHRLILLHRLLSENGSIYLHIDEKMVFHLKLVMDEVFGAQNYRNCVTRKKCNSKNYTRKSYGNIADYILFYTKSNNYIWNRQFEPWTEDRAREYHYVDEKTGRRFMKVPIHAPGTRNGETGKTWRGLRPPLGKHWQYTPARLDEMDRRGEIYWSASGNPRRKVFLDERPGVGVQDIWLDYKDAHNQNVHITGYPTEKNSDMLRRIILASSNPGGLVLDCFCGSGTTLAVANELERRWIGADSSAHAIGTILHRFIRGTSAMGDFASATRKKLSDSQPGLFGSLAEDSISPNQAARPITEMELFAVSSANPKIDELVGKWNCEAAAVDSSSSSGQIVSDVASRREPERVLARIDPVLASLIRRFGPYPMHSRRPQFGFVVEAIIGQQLSPKAAESILRRLQLACGGGLLTPKCILSMPIADLKKCGISGRKAKTIRAFGKALTNGTVTLSSFEKMSNEKIYEALTAFKGIGPWTAEMFLIFAMGRHDVFPMHDTALNGVIRELYRVDTTKPKVLQDLSNRWRPYRSVACWYLYKYKNAKS